MKKKNNSKFLSAVFLSLLTISGGVLAMPLLSADNQLTQIQESVKLFEKNPERFLQTENLGLKNGFENPNDFPIGMGSDKENNNAINEGALEAALEERDYDAWKEALQRIDGFSGSDVIDREDFNILVALHNSKDSGETELANL